MDGCKTGANKFWPLLIGDRNENCHIIKDTRQKCKQNDVSQFQLTSISPSLYIVDQ